MNRRDVLRAGGVAALASCAGCAGLFETQSAGEPALVENRPNAVYVPTHVEGMKMGGMAGRGDRMVALSYSFPHRFWTVTGRNTERVQVKQDDSVHLMVNLWDKQTETVLPVESGVQLTVKKDGETLTRRAPWPMLSQNMGFHYGDNVALDGDGTYTATVNLGSMGLRRLGAFEGRFGETGTVDVEFEYSESEKEDISFTSLSDRQGQRGAVDPMQMEMVPLSFAPERSALPGKLLGGGTSRDATFLATVVDRDGHYLAVSPRTPHNRYVLPMMALSATVEGSGETRFDDALRKALDPELGYHYGAPVEGLTADDDVTLTVDAPPQVSRHEGYETAFLRMSDVSL